MLSARALADVVAHNCWKIYARWLYTFWRVTGYSPKFLSSKGQDRWVIDDVFSGYRSGFFLEIGAGNGFTGSDTYILERRYAWRGICVEPNDALFRELTKVTKRGCLCICACVDGRYGVVDFALLGDRSGILAEDTDNNEVVRGALLRRLRAAGRVVQIASTTVADILDACGAPPVIDYFSLDVEGAEERILKTFPFDRYQVMAITVERPTHAIHNLLLAAGLMPVRQRWHDGFYAHHTMSHLSMGPAPTDFARKEF